METIFIFLFSCIRMAFGLMLCFANLAESINMLDVRMATKEGYWKRICTAGGERFRSRGPEIKQTRR
jgi:hypothetical protein